MAFSPLAPALATSFRALTAHPLRTALSTLGIVMGVASLVAVLAVGDGVERYSRIQLSQGTDLHIVTLQPRTTHTVDGITFPNPEHPVFTPGDAQAIASSLPGLAAVALMASGPGMVRAEGLATPRAALVSAQVGAPTRRMAAGRYLTDAERAGDTPVAVISHNLAAALGDTVEAVGRRIQVGEAAVEVVGVMAQGSETVFLVDVPHGILALAADTASRSVRAPELVVVAERLEDVPATRVALERWLGGRVPDWRRQVTIIQSQTRLEQAREAMGVFKLFMGAIVSISLLVGGIGVMNVLLASVTERTREIGIRRAAGARRRDVLWQFLSESVLVTGLGSGIGLVVGFSGAAGITAVMRARTSAWVDAALAWPTVAIAAGAAVLVGLVFGIYPALRASRLSPIDAIRHE